MNDREQPVFYPNPSYRRTNPAGKKSIRYERYDVAQYLSIKQRIKYRIDTITKG
jgi:hypothetical protein